MFGRHGKPIDPDREIELLKVTSTESAAMLARDVLKKAQAKADSLKPGDEFEININNKHDDVHFVEFSMLLMLRAKDFGLKLSRMHNDTAIFVVPEPA